MSKKMLTTAGISLALLAGAALPIQALAGDAPAKSFPIAVEQDDSMVVVRDAETGLARAPTAAEVTEMQARKDAKARNFRAAARPAMQKHHRSGARGARISPDQESISVAIRRADGTVETQCFDSPAAAQAALKDGSLTTSTQRETE